MQNVINEYLEASKGIIHEANEPKMAFRVGNRFCVILYNTEYENYAVIIFDVAAKTLLYSVPVKNISSAKDLFNSIKTKIGAQ